MGAPARDLGRREAELTARTSGDLHEWLILQVNALDSAAVPSDFLLTECGLVKFAPV